MRREGDHEWCIGKHVEGGGHSLPFCQNIRYSLNETEGNNVKTPAGQPVILPRLELNTFNMTLTCSVEQAEG